jgi:transcriptional regulator with XRE-family HTH domain
MVALHSNLKGLMAKYKMQNPDLAKLLGISVSTLSRKINGESDFNTTEIEKLKEIFKLPYEEIFFSSELLKTDS